MLAAACARHGVQLLTFSSDLVFDGALDRPYVESDTRRAAERLRPQQGRGRARVLDADPRRAGVRTSAFFGPWDEHNFVTQALHALARGEPFARRRRHDVSPTYVPDLVHACLDLLIDGECGIWHLANAGTLSWAELAARRPRAAGMDASRLEAVPARATAASPRRGRATRCCTASAAILLPALDDALARYLELRNEIDQEMEEVILMAESRQA